MTSVGIANMRCSQKAILTVIPCNTFNQIKLPQKRSANTALRFCPHTVYLVYIKRVSADSCTIYNIYYCNFTYFFLCNRFNKCVFNKLARPNRTPLFFHKSLVPYEFRLNQFFHNPYIIPFGMKDRQNI